MEKENVKRLTKQEVELLNKRMESNPDVMLQGSLVKQLVATAKFGFKEHCKTKKEC